PPSGMVRPAAREPFALRRGEGHRRSSRASPSDRPPDDTGYGVVGGPSPCYCQSSPPFQQSVAARPHSGAWRGHGSNSRRDWLYRRRNRKTPPGSRHLKTDNFLREIIQRIASLFVSSSPKYAPL